jgi:hypothetical protein
VLYFTLNQTMMQSQLLLLTLLTLGSCCTAFQAFVPLRARRGCCRPSALFVNKYNTDNDTDKYEQQVDQIQSYDQAGASLIQEEDQLLLDQMGDYDSNPAVGARTRCCVVYGLVDTVVNVKYSSHSLLHTFICRFYFVVQSG